MSTDVKRINSFFRTALTKEVDAVRKEINLSERQEEIFERFYIKKQDIGFIADDLNTCSTTVNGELKNIRAKMIKVI